MKYLLLIIAIVVSAACTTTEKTQNEQAVIDVPVDSIQPYEMSDFFSSVSYLRLAPNDSVLVGDISRVAIAGDYIYVLDNATIHILNKDGAHIKSLSIGKGPGEILQSLYFMVSPTGDLEVLDIMKIIKVYSAEGEFKRNHVLPKHVFGFEHLNDSVYILSQGVFSSAVKSHLIYAYNIKQDSIVRSYFKMPTFNGPMHCMLQRTPEGVMFSTSMYDNNVYVIDQDLELKVKYNIDFGRFNPPENAFHDNVKNGRINNQGMQRAGFWYNITNFHLDEDANCFFKARYGGKTITVQGNMENSTSFSVAESQLFADGIYPFVEPFIKGFSNNTIIYKTEPHKLISYFAKKKEELSESEFDKLINKYPDFYTLSSEVSEEDNPILVFAKLKEF